MNWHCIVTFMTAAAFICSIPARQPWPPQRYTAPAFVASPKPPPERWCVLGFPIRLSESDERSGRGYRSTAEDEDVQPAWCAFAIVAGVASLNISARTGWSSVIILNFIDSGGPFFLLILLALVAFFTSGAYDGEDVANLDS